MDNLKTLKSQVEFVLQKYPETRKNDTDLTGVIWVVFYPNIIFKNENGEFSVRLKDLKLLPREDNVKRIRAVIQNEKGMYLPDLETMTKRMKGSKKYQSNLLNL